MVGKYEDDLFVEHRVRLANFQMGIGESPKLELVKNKPSRQNEKKLFRKQQKATLKRWEAGNL